MGKPSHLMWEASTREQQLDIGVGPELRYLRGAHIRLGRITLTPADPCGQGRHLLIRPGERARRLIFNFLFHSTLLLRARHACLCTTGTHRLSKPAVDLIAVQELDPPNTGEKLAVSPGAGVSNWSAKNLRATAVDLPRGRPEMDTRLHSVSRPCTRTQSDPRVFTIVHPIRWMEMRLSRFEHSAPHSIQPLLPDDRLQKSRLALHATGRHRNWQAAVAPVKHPERTEKPDALHCRMCRREGARLLPAFVTSFRSFSARVGSHCVSCVASPALIGSWDYNFLLPCT